MSRVRWWQLLQWVLFLFILGALATIIMRYNSGLSELNWRLPYVIPFLIVSLMCILSRSLLVGELAAYFDVQLRFDEMLGLNVVSTTLSESLPASAGTLIRPAYLWRVHGLNLAASVVMVIANALMITGASSALSLVGLISIGWGSSVLTVMFLALLILCALPFFFARPPLVPLLGRRFQAKFRVWRQVYNNPRQSGRVLLLSMAVCMLDALRFWLAFLLIGIDFSFSSALIVSGVALLMGYFAIVPGALGFIEAAVAGVSALLGYQALHALTATLVFRAGILIFAVPTTPIFYFRLMKEMRSN